MTAQNKALARIGQTLLGEFQLAEKPAKGPLLLTKISIRLSLIKEPHPKARNALALRG